MPVSEARIQKIPEPVRAKAGESTDEGKEKEKTGKAWEARETGKAEILLANYKTDNDLPVKEWIWVDLTPIQNAVKVKFIPDSSDKNEYGIKTAAYFCLDGITLIEK